MKNKRTAENIFPHKKREEVFLEKEMLESLLDNIPDAVYFKDCCNRLIKVNKFYAQGVKLKPKEIVGKTDFDFFPKEQAQQMFDDDNRVLATGRPLVGVVERTLLPNGTWNQVITTKIPMRDKKDKIIGTMGITRDMTSYANLEKERMTMLINALGVLGRALELRDPYTFSHTRHVASIAERIAKALGWNEDHFLRVRLAGELHDLGKITIPLDILNKPGKLSKTEYCLIQEHVQNCCSFIENVEFPFPMKEIIYQHHERLDGSGYPRGLKKKQILPEARILAVSDVLEAMTHHRPYRAALGIEEAWYELRRGASSKYDSKIVEAVSALIEKKNKKPFWGDD